jgi:hypothetical protein
LIRKLKSIFSGKDVGVEEPVQGNIADDITSITSEPVEEDKPFSEPEPVIRRVIRVPAVADDIFPPVDDNPTYNRFWFGKRLILFDWF